MSDSYRISAFYRNRSKAETFCARRFIYARGRLACCNQFPVLFEEFAALRLSPEPETLCALALWVSLLLEKQLRIDRIPAVLVN